jgi:hypothetical protein
VKESTPSEDEKKATYGVRAGDVGAATTPGLYGPHCWGGGEREKL